MAEDFGLAPVMASTQEWWQPERDLGFWGRRDEEKEAYISNDKGRRKKKRERERSEKEGGGGGRRRSLLAWIFKSCQLHPFHPFFFPFARATHPIHHLFK
jgi:hypothetical protein